MEKLRMQSTEVVSDNMRYIAERFPNCLTETKDEHGKSIQVIDFDKLRQELSRDIVEGPEERYQFTWPDKRNAIRLANTPTTDTLRPCREESVDFDNTKNLYIEGDNLEVLKLLREDYLGKVKMIYIDPPYNTGNDFVYNDDFAQKSDKYVHNSGQEDEEGNRLVTNAESNGRFHTDWLNMIYPRLKVARDLLTDDGVIFISIDDNEVENLRKVCDEVFGESNFVECLKWKRKKQPSFLAKHTAKLMEYILVYAANFNSLAKLSIETISDSTKKVINITNNISDRVFKAGFRVKSVDEDSVIPKGIYKIRTMDVEYLDDIIVKEGRAVNDVRVRSRFTVTQDNINKYIKDDLLFVTANNGLRRDVSEEETTKRKSITDLLLDWGDNQESENEMKSIFGVSYFDYTKPTKLLYNLSKSVENDDFLVLDFFSGSATTAHAVMQLNSEEGGYRKFIMVQLPELTDEKSEAYKAGYKNICEIGKERIRRAGKKIKEELIAKQQDAGMFDDKEDKAAKLDTGFRVLKLDSSNMNEVYYTPVEFDEKSLFEENIKADRTDEDLLFQTMLELGIELSAQIDKKQIAGKDVFVVSDGYLIACFDEKVNEEVIKEIAQQKPYYFVMRDSSLAQDNVADNFDQIFDEYSKDTIRRIL